MPEREMVMIDAQTYQEPLGELVRTMVEKVFREGQNHIAGPVYIREDIATMLRYAGSIYNLLNYLNADERRNKDVDWHVRYGVTGMSMVRSLIDCLYNPPYAHDLIRQPWRERVDRLGTLRILR